jgi:riboflavin kinase/FMN adenylyltransferase
MLVLRDIVEAGPARGGCLSIGNFDGVHRGHQRILAELVTQSRSRGVPAVALTFDPHPIQLLAPDRAPPQLTTLARKAELIEHCGVDVLLVAAATPQLLLMPPAEFFAQIIRDRLRACAVVEGPNFNFGRDRAGDVRTLGELCHADGLSLTVVNPVEFDGVTVSSSTIRRAIRDGRMTDAVAMLGHPYQVEGIVAAGAGRGRAIGFPTANLTGVATLLPPDGVYAGMVPLDGGTYPAAVHLGPNPTFGEHERKLEVHLIGFSGVLYGQSLRVRLLDRIRETRTFTEREELISQLHRDIDRTRACVATLDGTAARTDD